MTQGDPDGLISWRGHQLRTLWEAHAGRLRGFLHSFAVDGDHRDDLEQQTWIRAWTGRNGFKGGSFWGWLRAIAWSVAIDDSRAARRIRLAKHRLSILGGPSDPTPERDLEGSELRLLLEVAIGTVLTPREREVVTMRFLDGLGPRETAEYLGISQAAMRTHLANGLKKLRSVLHERREDLV